MVVYSRGGVEGRKEGGFGLVDKGMTGVAEVVRWMGGTFAFWWY